jgi:hypothetical protein
LQLEKHAPNERAENLTVLRHRPLTDWSSAGNEAPSLVRRPRALDLAMMILGFTGLGFMSYRRKSKPALEAV